MIWEKSTSNTIRDRKTKYSLPGLLRAGWWQRLFATFEEVVGISVWVTILQGWTLQKGKSEGGSLGKGTMVSLRWFLSDAVPETVHWMPVLRATQWSWDVKWSTMRLALGFDVESEASRCWAFCGRSPVIFTDLCCTRNLVSLSGPLCILKRVTDAHNSRALLSWRLSSTSTHLPRRNLCSLPRGCFPSPSL